MKLLRLKINNERFRSLQPGFDLNFRDNEANEELAEFHPFCLAGLNGSGKSNLLEALANIFYHLECCVNNYPTYAYSRSESRPNDYELEYWIARNENPKNKEDLALIKIVKKKFEEPFMSVDGNEPFSISNERGKYYLPDLVVAYSSGENEILSLPFIKMKLFQYDSYLRDFFDGGYYEKPKSSLLFIDYEMSQAVLLTIFLFFDETVLKPIIKELKIEKIEQFRINLHNNWQKVINKTFEQLEVETIYEEDEKEGKNYRRILDHLSNEIEKLEKCATCTYISEDFKSLDFWVNQATCDAIRANFDDDPYKFFSVFQMLQALNERVENINAKREIYDSKGFYTEYKKREHPWFFYFSHFFIKKSENENSLLLKNLSDGEQQFLHTLGICLMLQNKRTLLLLDEPETHFNPDWRSKFISILSQALKAGGDNNLLKDIVLTSHSPFIISDCLPDKVIVFEKNAKKNEVICKNANDLEFNTWGTSIDIITEVIFKNRNTIGDYSRNELQKIDFNKIKSQEDVEKAKYLLSNLGDSLEKDLTILRLNKLNF